MTDQPTAPDEDRLKVASLRKLIEVERETALSMTSSGYVQGRIGGYDFVLEAIDRRWPDLVPDQP